MSYNEQRVDAQKTFPKVPSYMVVLSAKLEQNLFFSLLDPMGTCPRFIWRLT